MKNKNINLFGSNTGGIKYSDLLNDFIKPFESDFPIDMTVDDIVYFSMHAWNMGNISLILPENEFEKVVKSTDMEGFEEDILKKMIELKKKKYAEYERFISDFELKEKNGELILTVTTQEKEMFLEDMANNTTKDHFSKFDFDEGYINRYAIVIKPKQSLFDWIKSIDPEYPVEDEYQPNIYLINDEVDDLDQWLRKKYDRFFTLELEDRNDSRKEWPQKRSFKMFKE